MASEIQKKVKRVWIDGQTEDACYLGALLTNNLGYYGERLKTTFSCRIGENAAMPPLFDGEVCRFSAKPVTREDETVIRVAFDEEYAFNECDLVVAKTQMHARLEVAGNAVDAYAGNGNEVCVLRAKFGKPAVGKEITVRVFGKGVTLVQVYAWGQNVQKDASHTLQTDNQPFSIANSIALESISGISRTSFLDLEAYRWSESLKKAMGQSSADAVFSQKDPWGKLTYDPILPSFSEINPTVHLKLFKNETRSLCFAVTSLHVFDDCDVCVKVTDSDSDVSCRIFAFGAIPSRWNGVNAGPLFDGENAISSVQMSEYLTNGNDIKDFPVLHLRPCGSVLLWMKFSLQNPQSAKTKFVKKIEAGGAVVTVEVELLDIELPAQKLRIGAYSRCTEMVPFRYEDRYEREAQYQKELGINVFNVDFWKWNDFCEAAARVIPDSIFSVWVFGKYGHELYNRLIRTEADITDEMKHEITENVHTAVATAKRLGLGYERWEVQNADEPGVQNMQAFAAMCRLIKETDENINVYANPSFWKGWDKGLVESDDDTYDALKAWYGQYVDHSCPHALNLTAHPKTYACYTAPRKFNTFYDVLTQHSKSERPEVTGLLRDLAWIALKNGFGGWSYYAYYRPIGDPWNDLDLDLPDYSVVYPGELGPIPTRASEALREGLQDYKLMKLLQSLNADEYEKILGDYENGERDFEKLRERALQAVLSKINNKR